MAAKKPAKKVAKAPAKKSSAVGKVAKAVGKVASGSVAGNVLTLKLKEPTSAKKITYLKEIEWSQEKLLMGANGLAALTFANVPLLVK